MDYEHTIQLYAQAKQNKQFLETAEYLDYKKELKWLETVKSKRTGEFFQAEDLKRSEMVPTDWQTPHVDAKGKPLKYPLKYVNSIIRLRTAEDSEYLKSRQTWIGLDQAGNPVCISMDDKELFNDILPIYKMKPKKPNDRDSKMIREVRAIEHKTRYTMLYNPENVQKLYDMRRGPCSLIIKDESRGDTPHIVVESFEDFKNKSIDDILEIRRRALAGDRIRATTPGA
ncbi:hypothetical protein BH18THE2_BH18THE2_37580 [soil metagenome]